MRSAISTFWAGIHKGIKSVKIKERKPIHWRSLDEKKDLLCDRETKNIESGRDQLMERNTYDEVAWASQCFEM